MCEACENEVCRRQRTETKRRLKLWEVKPQYHCAILGTCLSMEDLRKVMRQSGVVLERGYSDYELHGTLVGQATERNRSSHHLQKLLERKYRRWTQAAATLREPGALLAFWDEHTRAGEIAGPFWALVTHPHVDAELLTRAYGEVHMLSHLQGASNRADRQRLSQQAGEIDALQSRLSRLRRHHQGQLDQRDRLIRQQREQIRSLNIDRSESTERQRQGHKEETSSTAALRVRRLHRAEERLAQREMELDHLRQEVCALRELLDEARDEHAAMEQTLSQLLQARAGESSAQQQLDLRGQRILYVGGRSALAPHLRSLVESSNGRFQHHDGGLEENRAGLKCSLAGADMVFCPVDCVSHDACLRVKRHCRQQAKRFIPLRSSGLSAFAAGLRQSCTRTSRADA